MRNHSLHASLQSLKLLSGFGLLSICLGLYLSTFAVFAKAGMKEDLSNGPYVLMMRHADAPGYSDPTGYQLNDCSTQRNLGEAGKQQAREIGQWLSREGIQTAQVYSSPWCRCKDTAALLNKGVVQIDAGLGSFFENRGDRHEHTRMVQTKIASLIRTNPRLPIIMVTHQVNIQAFTGQYLSSGAVVLVKVNSAGQYVSHRLLEAPGVKP